MRKPAAPVSCYIRTLNEERTIGRVITAVRNAVAEVVVVDCGSTDRTAAIAQAAGARVVRQDWLGNGRQKRFGEDQCRNDFVLDLDADEVVSPELAEEICSLFAAGPPPHQVYELKLVPAPPVGKPWRGRLLVAYRRKLYNRRIVRAPDHVVWDQFEVPPGIKVGRLSGDLLHYYYRDIAHIVAKLNRGSTVRAEGGKKRGRTIVALRVLFGLPFYFFKHLVFRGLFLQGVYGVAIAGLAAYGRWLRDAKMYERILFDRAKSAQADGATASSAEPEKELKPQ